MATQDRKPATLFRCGNVNAAVWENTGEKRVFFSVTFSRSAKDAEGNWKTSASYGLTDLGALASVAEMGKDWVRRQARYHLHLQPKASGALRRFPSTLKEKLR